MLERANIIKKTDDASYTYRGYRKQILFIVHEILNSSGQNSIFCPEGIEDFSIIDSGSVRVIYQVKDLSEPLQFSDLSSGETTSFIQRAYSYYREYPDSDIIIGHYNPLGPELHKLTNNNKEVLDTVVKKLNKFNICPVNDSEKLIKKIEFKRLSEQDITDSIKKIITSSILGIDEEITVDI